MSDELNTSNLPESNDSQPAANAPAASPAEPEPIDPQVLKSAFNAFKKRWKLTRLDHESRIGRSPLSAGNNQSSIVGIGAPKEFPRAVWEELVRQGRLKNAGGGMYSLP